MTHELVFAGFGGQGIMFMGLLLTYSGMKSDLEVSWIPSYGPEMRGGTANCSVVVSSEPIASPMVTEPTGAVVMNQPSLEKFAPLVVPGGSLLINDSLASPEDVNRDDIKVHSVPATETATELGNVRVANMVALGAFLEIIGAVQLETVKNSVADLLPQRRQKLIPLNLEALEAGYQLIRGHK